MSEGEKQLRRIAAALELIVGQLVGLAMLAGFLAGMVLVRLWR